MTAAALVAQLAAAGTPPELLAAVAQELFLAEAERLALAGRRKNERERKARSREVTGQDVTGADPFLDKKSPQTPSKTKPIQVSPFIPQTMTAWNEMSAKHGLPSVQGISGKRKRALMARIDEHGFEAVLRAISSVPTSPHWLGENGWLGNLDSLLRPDNFQRMIEGAYLAKGQASLVAIEAEWTPERRAEALARFSERDAA